jgi:hypothetical protein
MSRPLLGNRDARRLFLHRHALCEASGPATGGGLLALIGRVRVDLTRRYVSARGKRVRGEAPDAA